MRLQDVILRDTRANQPVAGLVAPGSLYFVTDESIIERSNGLIWQSYGGGLGTTGPTGIQGIPGLNGIDGIDGERGIPGVAGSGGGGSVGSDSLTVNQSAATATINYDLSTLGTVDWFASNGNTVASPRIWSGALHWKSGGILALTFDWINPSQGATMFASGTWGNYSTTFPDDHYSSLSAVQGMTGIFNTAGARYGFAFHIPASKATRRLIICVGSFSCDTELVVKLNGQIETIVTNNYSGTLSVSRDDFFTIDFSAPQGGELTVRYTLKTVLGTNTNPNIKFGWAYVTVP